MVKYRATSLVKTFASNIHKLFLLKISLFLYIPLVILISKCWSAFPELAVIVLNWERKVNANVIFLVFSHVSASEMNLFPVRLDTWQRYNNIHHYLSTPFPFVSIMLSWCFVHQLYTFFKIFCHTNYCQKVFSTNFCWNQRCKLEVTLL